MLDLLIKNGTLIDGVNHLNTRLDIGIKDEKIAVIGTNLGDTLTTIDTQNKVVCPGFIDMHTHSGLVVFERPELLPKIRQGITTEVIGLDGISVAPVSDEGLKNRQQYLKAIDYKIDGAWRWRTFPEYLACLSALTPGPNLIPLVPHGALRDVVIGTANRPTTDAELAKMADLLEEGLSSGARGLSLGLVYVPGMYADTRELTALAKVVGKHDSTISVHVRNEADGLVESLIEMRDLARNSGAKMHISHLKIIGIQNSHLLEQVMRIFDDCEKDGSPITFDQYPYTAGCTQLAVVLPPWARIGDTNTQIKRLQDNTERQKMRQDIESGIEGWENPARLCGWENVFVASTLTEKNRFCVGKSIAEIAAQIAKDPFSAVFDLLVDEALQVGMINFYTDENVVTEIMQSKFHTVGSDGIFNDERPHPRLYGTFPRILGHYVREKQILSLAEAIRRMAFAPAERLGLAKRGALQEGYYADLVIFDPAIVNDRATYDVPMVYPDGIEWVMVNGKIAIDSAGKFCAANGRVLI